MKFNFKNQIKSDNAVHSIIINNLEKSNKEYLRGCKTAYSMIDRLKKRFYQSGQALLYCWIKISILS